MFFVSLCILYCLPEGSLSNSRKRGFEESPKIYGAFCLLHLWQPSLWCLCDLPAHFHKPWLFTPFLSPWITIPSRDLVGRTPSMRLFWSNSRASLLTEKLFSFLKRCRHCIAFMKIYLELAVMLRLPLIKVPKYLVLKSTISTGRSVTFIWKWNGMLLLLLTLSLGLLAFIPS